MRGCPALEPPPIGPPSSSSSSSPLPAQSAPLDLVSARVQVTRWISVPATGVPQMNCRLGRGGEVLSITPPRAR
ncbi:hypothetical protein G7K_6411-t1 [Saitoella complicata NRRL Y-17804]|uniref:Uncharacterized protein n=1 Tax=Saitoella complicata (strain BCRC 22490 / CBS 7301 / JCM 7358 / NBRC 10748 / NRRL Y-17804) TaxID=698492 RepID=A0A0E9NR24_SAICN|nr:hypothetical protein G7K_6411-t1 [Saitoella complicata NRRL Y-17804]